MGGPMEIITKDQIKLIHTLLSDFAKQRGFPVEREEKQAFVKDCSRGRCTSTTQLIQSEARALIESLQGLLHSTSNWEMQDKQRKFMLHLAHQMSWTKDGRADVDRLSAWCIKTGYLHKPLMRYTEQELPRLVHQFKNVYKAFLNSIV